MNPGTYHEITGFGVVARAIEAHSTFDVTATPNFGGVRGEGDTAAPIEACASAPTPQACR
jgi:hypothetical protein